MAANNIHELFQIAWKWQEAIEKNDTAIIERAQRLCDVASDQEILETYVKSGHPFLHEICHQYHHMFDFIKFLWQQPKFRPYWDNDKYLDKYCLTALERLALGLNKNSENEREKIRIAWFRENMRVIPAERDYSRDSFGRIFLKTPYLLEN